MSQSGVVLASRKPGLSSASRAHNIGATQAVSSSLSQRSVRHGVVLAGTHPWSHCPLDRTIPRSLLPIANRQLIRYSLDWLFNSGVAGACICGNSHTAAIRDGLDRSNLSGEPIDFYADFMPRGPAGCVKDAAQRCDADILIVVDATMVPRVDLDQLIRAHEQSNSVLTIAVHSDPNEQTRPNHQLTPVGVYVFARDAFEHISPTGYQDIKEELIPELYRLDLPMTIFPTSEWSPRVTDADTYLMVNDWMVGQAASPDIHPSVHVEKDVRLIGPVAIAAGALVKCGALIVGPTSIGENSVIGERAVVCRSAIWSDAEVGQDSVVDRSVVMNGGKIAPGTTLRHAIHG